jgi:branched-chain amino acid transport system substrate-binding protein
MRQARSCAGILFLSALFAFLPASHAYAQDILFGVSTAITGPAPLDGERTKQGVLMAVEEINQRGGVLGKKLTPIIEDDQNTSNVAVNAVNKLVSQPIVALVGPHRSANATAVNNIVTRNKIPYLTGATSPKLLALNNPYFFRTRASDAIVAKIAAKYAVEELKAKKVGIFFNNDEYGTGARDVIESYLKSINVAFISEGHNTGDKDMTGQIMKAKNNKIDALIVWAHDPECAVSARQAKELNLAAPFIGSPGYSTSSVLDLLDTTVSNGIITVTDFVANTPEPKVQQFTQKFRQKYNVDPELYAASYYDAVYILADAIKRANSTEREAIRKALSETKGFQGVMSTLAANAKGELVHEAVVAKIQDKSPQLIKIVRD